MRGLESPRLNAGMDKRPNKVDHLKTMNVIFLEGNEGLGIPYPKGTEPGSTNIGYHDVRKRPDSVLLFPEIQDRPELIEFIQAVSHPQSLFRTLRCDVSLSAVQILDFRWKITSYVTIAFEILEWNGAIDNYKKMFENFRELAEQTKVPDDGTIVEFEVQPTSYNDHLYGGFSVDLWVTGLGKSEEESLAKWVGALDVIKSFLAYESLRYANQLQKGYKTLG